MRDRARVKQHARGALCPHEHIITIEVTELAAYFRLAKSPRSAAI
jgi:hypothetical protein